ncbi:MAG: peroxiredoxin [Candidatus Nanohaloarchaea archaeon]
MENNIPLIGEDFPEITAKSTHGRIELPEDYSGEWLVLFSHPGDFTPVCTTEFLAFQQRKEEFDELNANLVGLSVDRVHSHIKWTEWIEDEFGEEIEFPIIADESGEVAEELGMLQGGSTSTVRAVFIVDPEGVVRQVLYYPEEAGRNIDEILRSLKALQTSDSEGVALPANWPENEDFGDSALLPPPSTDEEMRERIREAEDQGYDIRDWWFVLRDLD